MQVFRRPKWIATGSALAVGIVVAVSMSPAEAVPYTGGHSLTGGVYGRQYWVDSSAAAHSSTIYSAKWRWGTEASGLVAWAETSNYATSELDFYLEPAGVGGLDCGLTWHFAGGTRVQPGTPNWADWNFAEVHLMNYFNDLILCPNSQGIVVHEMGHAMGLNHAPPGVTSIMRGDIAGYTSWKSPKAYDVADIAAIY